jgi:hypothetical protein
MIEPNLSRRSIFGAFAASLLGSTTLPAEGTSTDERLVTLGREYSELSAAIDRAYDQETDFPEVWIDRVSQLEAEIVTTPATTTVGMCAKARIVCSILHGNFDPIEDEFAPTKVRMELSIVRDLIRLHDPGLDQSGALQPLVEDST